MVGRSAACVPICFVSYKRGDSAALLLDNSTAKGPDYINVITHAEL